MAILSWAKPETDEDWLKWNAKLVNKTTERPHVEIRTCRDNEDILIVVSLTGEMKLQFGNKATEHANVRLSSRNPIRLSFDDWEQLSLAVKEAKRLLCKIQQKASRDV